MSSEKVSFKLVGITTDEFAILGDQYREGEEVRILPELSFGLDPEKRGVVAYVNIRLEQSERPFLKLQCSSYFEIEAEAWETFKTEDGKGFELPKGFARHLGVLAVGTSRGVLHAKTENTPYNRFFLPTVDLTGVIEEAMVFEWNDGEGRDDPSGHGQ